MTPPPALAVEMVADEGTATSEFERQLHADPFQLREQSYSVYTEEVLRRAADAVILQTETELDRRRLRDAGPLGVRALLDEAGRTPREEVLHLGAEALAKVCETSGGLDSVASEAMTHPNPVKRALAIRALGYLPEHGPAQVLVLQRALEDAHPEVRETAANALSEVGDAAALPSLRAALAREKTEYIADILRETIEELEG